MEHISADDAASADDSVAAEDRGAGVDRDVIFDGRMPFLAAKTLAKSGAKAPSVTP